MKDTTQNCFKVGLDKLFKHLLPTGGTQLTDDHIRSVYLLDTGSTVIVCRSVFFGDYMVPGAESRAYDEVTDLTQLTTVIEK